MFKDLKRQLQANFDELAKEPHLYYVDINRERIWEEYISGFAPALAQEHECNACKSFLRQYSGIVAIVERVRIGMWDYLDNVPSEFQQSVDNIKKYIASLPISNVWFTDNKKCGVDTNKDEDKLWDHFFLTAPSKFVYKNSTISIESKQGDLRTTKDMFERALNELTIEATDTVIELINQNSIYRGQEFLKTVVDFNTVQNLFKSMTEARKINEIWVASLSYPLNVTRIRNSAIGTLLINLSEGMNLNSAVAKYEVVVAPTNYKRTTALVTPGMVKDAKKKLKELGLLDSLQRRHASLTDIDVDNLLFIDKSNELILDEFDELSKDSKKNKIMSKQELSKVEEITIEKFIKDVLPTLTSMELYVEDRHLNSFVSIIAGVNSESASLFKWNNLFSWSYTGGITDSIKQRVKAQGGQITGELRVSLSWSNYDDLDLWVTTPDNSKIYHGNKLDTRTGGNLDVDMNIYNSDSREAVENIIFPTKDKMLNGDYVVRVNQYSRREAIDVGYTVQIEHEGELTEIVSRKSPVKNNVACVITYNRDGSLKFDKDYSSNIVQKEKWGLKTHSFVKVKQMMLSPNHWNKPGGNKHFMFMLENCLNDEEAKPFFNEFLNNTFVENRKVFEILADKFKVPASVDQLSGVGFSETKANEVILRVESSFKRLLKIKF